MFSSEALLVYTTLSYLGSMCMRNGRGNSTQGRAMGNDASFVNFEGVRYDEREDTRREVKRLKEGGSYLGYGDNFWGERDCQGHGVVEIKQGMRAMGPQRDKQGKGPGKRPPGHLYSDN